MKFLVFLALLLSSAGAAVAQSQLRVLVRDALTHTPLPGVTVAIPTLHTGAATDASGLATLPSVPNGSQQVVFSSLGYAPRTLSLTLPQFTTGPLLVELTASAAAIEEVVVTATRTNSRLEDQPERIEVLGEEEMREEGGIKPGNIASLLNDIAGTQVQPTSPTTGNADLRIQGLQGQYSQILRDGLPLYGGFAGSFGLLAVPPLDLRQVELLKGSNSTLYGGGAIAGLVNLVSKTPTLGTPQFTATLNQTTLRETNLNGFAAQRGQQWGYSFFGGLTRQQDVDVDGDGFVDVPRVHSLTVHPRLFYYPNAHSQLAVGYTGTFDERRGGDQTVLREGPDAAGGHVYFVTNTSQRHTVDAVYTNDSVAAGRLTLKGVVTRFSRAVQTNTVDFGADQTTYYTEASYLRPLGPQHTLVVGGNVNGERLITPASSATPLLSPYTYGTVGGFVQDDWHPTARFNVQAGFRLDHHNQYGTFPLPRLAVRYQLSEAFTARLNGGLGYRVPVPYVNSLDEREYPQIQPLQGLRAETSQGLNGDLNYQHVIPHFDDDGAPLILSLNQSFFYTRLQDPLVLPDGTAGNGLYQPGSGPLSWQNAAAPVVTKGLETYLRVRVDETELYLGYVYTDARRQYDPVNPHVELAARHKFAAVGTVEVSDNFGAGLEAAYTGQQYRSDGTTTPGYPIFAALLRYRLGPWTLVLNGENLLDYRQTRHERVVLPPYGNPVFRELWAPVEGRAINLSLNWRFGATGF
ncbi:TonB-dependent receptor [Siccationidurans ginsengisoli]|nr:MULTISPECIES: TonB-dependent receptor [unclassified Hymenobacter]MBO2033442.1 TonB-dependent receptor [Hymenobacter sp. BT559]